MCEARSRLGLLTGAIALVLGAGALWAQDSPVRPRLAAEADTNDWQAYFDYGVEQLQRVPGRADAAFYWAGRLDPWRSEPFYGRWVTYWMRHDGDWADYLAENPGSYENQRSAGPIRCSWPLWSGILSQAEGSRRSSIIPYRESGVTT